MRAGAWGGLCGGWFHAECSCEEGGEICKEVKLCTIMYGEELKTGGCVERCEGTGVGIREAAAALHVCTALHTTGSPVFCIKETRSQSSIHNYPS